MLVNAFAYRRRSDANPDIGGAYRDFHPERARQAGIADSEGVYGEIAPIIQVAPAADDLHADVKLASHDGPSGNVGGDVGRTASAAGGGRDGMRVRADERQEEKEANSENEGPDGGAPRRKWVRGK